MSQLKLSVVVCGNFGHRRSQIDGQTIKTRVLAQGFRDLSIIDKVQMIDTSFILTNPLRVLLSLFRAIRTSDFVVVMPGCRGLVVLLPLVTIISKSFVKPLHYVVVGGWLPSLLQKHAWLKKLCGKLEAIWVETSSMSEAMARLGLRNVGVLPNFRKLDKGRRMTHAPTTVPLKLVFYSRVVPEKGVELAIEAVERLNSKSESEVLVVLDIYGPIPASYEQRFSQILKNVRNASYKGVLSPEDGGQTLQNYDLMIFPTFYEGEGFPGALVDAFIAGLPVVASAWKYNHEVVVDGVTGVLFKSHEVEDIVRTVQGFVENPELVAPMRRNCLESAQLYDVDLAVRRIVSCDLGPR